MKLLLFVEPFLFLEVLEQLSSLHELHHKVNPNRGVETIFETNKEGVACAATPRRVCQQLDLGRLGSVLQSDNDPSFESQVFQDGCRRGVRIEAREKQGILVYIPREGRTCSTDAP